MRDADSLMWTTRPCPGCQARVTVPRDLDETAPTRLCFACQAWHRVEQQRLKAGLAPAIENNLGQDDDRDAIASAVLLLLEQPDATEQTYLAPKPDAAG